MPKGVYKRKNSKKPKKAKMVKKIKKIKNVAKPKMTTKVIEALAGRITAVDRAGRPLKDARTRKERLAAGRKANEKILAERLARKRAEAHSKVASDARVNPSHYADVGNSGQEVIDVLEDFNLTDNAYRFVAIQYMFRAGRKIDGDTIVDLQKAKWYIEREIAFIATRKGGR